MSDTGTGMSSSFQSMVLAPADRLVICTARRGAGPSPPYEEKRPPAGRDGSASPPPGGHLLGAEHAVGVAIRGSSDAHRMLGGRPPHVRPASTGREAAGVVRAGA